MLTRMLRNWNSYALLVGMWNSIVAMMRTVWQFLKKLNIEQLCALAILLLGIYPKEFKARTQILVHNVPEIWFTIARVQTTYMPINRWVNKMWYMYAYIYIWSGLPFPSPGDLPDPGIKPGLNPGRFFTTSITWENFQCSCPQMLGPV